MAKFKVGDRVIVVDTKYVSCKIGDKGTIKRRMFKGEMGDCYAIQMDEKNTLYHTCDGFTPEWSGKYVWDRNIKLIEEKPTREFKLIITSSGDTTTAKLIHGKDIAKEATVTRYSKDEYSEKAAVEAVVKKIFGEDEKKNEANKPYTGKAVWICDNESVYTKGKIYEFVDGKFKHDLGFTVVGYTLEKMKRLGCFLPIVE